MSAINPIILKEFLQDARRRRTWVFRVILPGTAFLILSVWTLAVLVRAGADWGAVAEVERPLFAVLGWMQLIAFSLFSAIYTRGTLEEEWTHKTMEVLCAAPVSRPGIIYGKFAGVQGRVLMMGLALLPMMGVWIRLVRLPTSEALGSLAVIGASAVLFGALVLVRAAAYQPGRGLARFSLDLLVMYHLLMVVLGVWAWPGHPVLVAGVPYWSFSYVMDGTVPGGSAMASGRFALLAILEPLGVGAVALAASPWVFSRALNRYIGSDGGGRSILPAWLRYGRRKTLGPEASPFFWQETGAATRGLRWALWISYATMGAGLAVAHAAGLDVSWAWGDPDLILVGVAVGAGAVSLMAWLYGAQVFARERARQTAQALVLTGMPAWRIYLAKLRALGWALKWTAVGLAGPLVAYLVLADRPAVAAWVAVAAGALLVPVGLCVVGMVFSAASRSTAQAVSGMVLALGWTAVMGLCVFTGVGPIGGLVGFILMVTLVKHWTAWRLSFLMAFALSINLGVAAGLSMVMAFMGVMSGGYGEDETLITVLMTYGAVILSLGNIVFWFFHGVRIFDRCMSGEVAPSGR